MKDLKAFLEVMGKDNELSEKVRCAKDVKEMVKIANEAGYAVTEDEMNDILMEAVAGGNFLNGFVKSLSNIAEDVVLDTMDEIVATKSDGGTWADAAANAGAAAIDTGVRTTIKEIGRGLQKLRGRRRSR